MLKAPLGLVLGLVIGGSIGLTQQSQERIPIGAVPLQLGTPKEVALSKLAEKGYHLSKIEKRDEWIVAERNEQTNSWDVRGDLFFEDGRLTWASRTWESTFDTGSAKLAGRLYLLVQSFEDSGKKACTIETDGKKAQEWESRGLKIHCSKRTITLYVTRYKQQDPDTELGETIQ